jgi:hypothetical protein
MLSFVLLFVIPWASRYFGGLLVIFQGFRGTVFVKQIEARAAGLRLYSGFDYRQLPKNNG